jgi:signal transduction histidine kinase
MKLPVLSLRMRLTLLLGVTTLIALGVAIKIVDWRADAEMQQRFDATLLARAQAFAGLTRIEDGRIGFDAIPPDTMLSTTSGEDDRWAVRCNGRLVTASVQMPPDIASGDSPRFANTVLANGRILRVVSMRFDPVRDAIDTHAATAPAVARCSLEYAIDRGRLDDILDTLDWIMIGSVVGAIALVLGLTPWLVRRGLHPIDVLNQAMTEIGPDAPGKRVPTDVPSELAPLATRFNEALARMDDGLLRERQFASGMAHEFRTHLAELRTLVEVETRYPSERNSEDLLHEIGGIGLDMETTVNALLKLTRIESGLESAAHENVLLHPWLTDMLARHAEAREKRGVTFRFTPPEPQASLDTDTALLGVVLNNLLGNAVSYAPDGTCIDVICSEHCIEIANDAPGLEQCDLLKFGHRFWRKHAEGMGQHAGLGLALADAAARAIRMRLDFRLESGNRLHAALNW